MDCTVQYIFYSELIEKNTIFGLRFANIRVFENVSILEIGDKNNINLSPTFDRINSYFYDKHSVVNKNNNVIYITVVCDTKNNLPHF